MARIDVKSDIFFFAHFGQISDWLDHACQFLGPRKGQKTCARSNCLHQNFSCDLSLFVDGNPFTHARKLFHALHRQKDRGGLCIRCENMILAAALHFLKIVRKESAMDCFCSTKAKMASASLLSSQTV